jgi:hypothetical protein
MATSELQVRIKKQRQMGLKGAHWDNHAVARYTLDGELGLNGHPRSVRFTLPTSFVVSCHVPVRSVSALIFSTMRLMLFFDGR